MSPFLHCTIFADNFSIIILQRLKGYLQMDIALWVSGECSENDGCCWRKFALNRISPHLKGDKNLKLWSFGLFTKLHFKLGKL